MDISKLFGVLVVGGSMLTTACSEDDTTPPDDQDPIEQGTADAAGAHPDGAAVDGGGDDAGELIDCGFCPNEMCCEVDDEGNSSVKVGFECCWSTTC